MFWVGNKTIAKASFFCFWYIKNKHSVYRLKTMMYLEIAPLSIEMYRSYLLLPLLKMYF